MPRLSYPQLAKPIVGTRIDPTHPLAQGLVAAWVFNEGGGTPFEVVRGKPPSSAASFAWGTGAYGLHGVFNGSSSVLGYNAVAPNTSVISLAGSCTLNTLSASNMLIERSPINTIWEVYFASSNSSFNWLCGAGGTVRNKIPAASLTAGKRFSWGITDTGVGTGASNGSTMYLNGVAQAAGGGASNLPAVASSATIYLGAYDNGVGGFLSGSQDYIFIWNYALSAASMAAIAADPWQIFRPAPTFEAAWYPQSAPPSIVYSFSGPSTSYIGNPSTAFTVTSNSVAADTISLASSPSGVTFVPSSLSWPTNSTFTANAAGTGNYTITPSSANGAFTPVNTVLDSLAITYTFAGPAGGAVNTNSAPFTITAVANTTDTFALGDNSNGTFYPSTPTITAGNSCTFLYKPASLGTIVITPTSNAGDTITPSFLDYTSTNGGGGLLNWIAWKSTMDARGYRRRRRRGA
jgi:hypothetical protein